MKVFDLVHVAWQGAARRKLRTVLTATSLTIGVLTLVVVQSAQSLVQEATLRQAILRDGPAATVRIGLTADASAQYWRDRVTHAVPAARVAAYDGYPSTNLSKADGEPTAVDLLAVDPSLRQIRPFEIVAGSWLTEPHLAPQLVLNRAAAARLGSTAPEATAPEATAPEATAPGSASLASGSARVDAPEGRLAVVVIGVIDDGEAGLNAYVAASAEPALAGVGLRPASRSLLLTANAINTGRLREIADIAGRGADIEDVSRVDTVNDFDDQLATQRRIFLAIAVLCLLVGSLGILNIGLSTLRERTEELALRRALGASRLAIATIMLLESQIVAVAAALTAVLAAFLAVPWFLTHLTSVHVSAPQPPLTAIAWGVSASALAALAGALTPSLRAAHVPIASLLR